MYRNLTHFANLIFIRSGWLSSFWFRKELHVPEKRQARLLKKYIVKNKNTAFGKKWNFKEISNYDRFATIVPIIENWEQLDTELESITCGMENVLTSQKIVAFESTSGSSSKRKLIPYTAMLKKEFQKAVHVWMTCLYKERPEVFYGTAYWSISPPLKEKGKTIGGIQIGLESDKEYFGPITARILNKIMAVDDTLTSIKDADGFYFESLVQLIQSQNLTFISVWSPTYFIQLDQFLRSNFKSIISQFKLQEPERYAYLSQINSIDFQWKDIWPNLSCISVWTDAQSSIWIPKLRNLIGDVFVQPKGLLSTEAVISIPYYKLNSPILAYQSHFFEFRHVLTRVIVLAHMVQKSEIYEVIVTTGGGLYRYCTKDLVRIEGFHEKVPLIKFMGRSARTSDLVGEKLTENHINEAVSRVFYSYLEQINSLFISPVIESEKAGYFIYIETANSVLKDEIAIFVEHMENELLKNPYYKQALKANQLNPLKFKFLNSGFSIILRKNYALKKRIKDGDIKLPMLFLPYELNQIVETNV